MDVDMLKRHLAHVVQAGEHHPRDPQRDDVARRDEDGAGVEEVEDFVAVPAEFEISNLKFDPMPATAASADCAPDPASPAWHVARGRN